MKKLYKYYSFNTNSLLAVSEPYLWFSQMDNLNDPFEGKIQLSQNVLETTKATELLGAIMEAYNPEINKVEIDELVRFKRKELGDADFGKFVRQTCNKAFLENEDIQRNSFCSFISVQEPEENLSSSQQILMWSHYSNGMKGFRLEFETEALMNSLEENPDIRKINYNSSPSEVDIQNLAYKNYVLKENITTELTEFLFSKHIDWKYECEIRLGDKKHGAHKYDPKAIKAITLGERLSEEEKKLIARIISSHNSNIAIQTAQVTPYDYKIEVKPYQQ